SAPTCCDRSSSPAPPPASETKSERAGGERTNVAAAPVLMAASEGGRRMSTFLGYVAIGVTSGFVYALLALGIVLIYKGSRVVNLAHPFFGLLAAFLAWWMIHKASFPPFSWLPFQLDSRPRVVLCALIALVVVGINGFLLERTVMRRLRRAPRLVALVATVALGEGTLGTVHLLFGRTQEQATEYRHIPSVMLTHFSFGTRVVTGDDISVFIVTAIVAAVAVW